MAAALISFDTSQLGALAARLGSINANAIGQAEIAAVNKVTDRAYTAARKAMIAGINLPDAYLRARMTVTPASDPARPEAVIRAAYQHTSLARYGAIQLTRSAAAGGKGDAARGIAPGLKGAGVSVEVTRGSRKTISNAFMVPLKNGNGVGVFVRDPGAKKPRILYGPSVYQLFRASIDNVHDAIELDLEKTVTGALVDLVNEAIP